MDRVVPSAVSNQPKRLDGWRDYSEPEHQIWQTLFDRQMARLCGRADESFFTGLRSIGLDRIGIPDLDQVSNRLRSLTGWTLVPVSGWLHETDFFAALSRREFPCGDFIRGKDQLGYIKEPDIFHDLFGHVPILSNPVFADFMQLFGQWGVTATTKDALQIAARVYWFTVEFGLIAEAPGQRKIFGAGILSSPHESVSSLEHDASQYWEFEIDKVVQTDYEIDSPQPGYFVISSYDQLLDLEKWFPRL